LNFAEVRFGGRLGRWPGLKLILTPCFERHAVYFSKAARAAGLRVRGRPLGGAPGAELRQATNAARIFFWSVVLPSVTPCFLRQLWKALAAGAFGGLAAEPTAARARAARPVATSVEARTASRSLRQA